jgi:Na+/H+-translocating membrane pyrophosphatase
MATFSMKYQSIMHRLMEPGKEPNITRGTLEGQIRPGSMTIFRLQSTADAEMKAYVAEGEILNIDPKSFGCIAVFAIKEMARFYRHALLEKRFPHHTAVAFVFGAFCSGLAGLIGMWIAVRANLRSAAAARTSAGRAIVLALRGGAVSGLTIVALSLLGVSLFLPSFPSI